MKSRIRKSLEILALVAACSVGCAHKEIREDIKVEVGDNKVIIKDYRPRAYEIKLPEPPTYEINIEEKCPPTCPFYQPSQTQTQQYRLIPKYPSTPTYPSTLTYPSTPTYPSGLTTPKTETQETKTEKLTPDARKFPSGPNPFRK